MATAEMHLISALLSPFSPLPTKMSYFSFPNNGKGVRKWKENLIAGIQRLNAASKEDPDAGKWHGRRVNRVYNAKAHICASALSSPHRRRLWVKGPSALVCSDLSARRWRRKWGPPKVLSLLFAEDQQPCGPSFPSRSPSGRRRRKTSSPNIEGKERQATKEDFVASPSSSQWPSSGGRLGRPLSVRSVTKPRQWLTHRRPSTP